MIQAVNMQKMHLVKSSQKKRENHTQKIGFGQGAEETIAKAINNTISEKSGFIKKMHWLNGSIDDNAKSLINGIGTAVIAPIMIVFNPFAKGDLKKRLFSALRQPVSAVCNIGLSVISGGMAEALIKGAAKRGLLGKKFDTRPLAQNASEEAQKAFKYANNRVKTIGTLASLIVGVAAMPLHTKILNTLYPPFAKTFSPILEKFISSKNTKKETPKTEGGNK